MIARLVVLAALLIGCGVFAWWWRARQGRFTEGHGRFDRSDLGLGWRDKPTTVLVEFFGEHCAPCVVLRARLDVLAAELPDISVITIDAGENLDLAGRYGVRRVPTLFVTDENLKIRWRASGLPSDHDLREVLLGPDWAGRPHPAAEAARATEV